jgi:sulfate transport system ATP-binding protein
MSFIGPVNRLGNQFIRPHDFELRLEPNGSTEEAMIDRIVHLGFEVRVEFSLKDESQAWAQLTKAEADQLELHVGQIVFVRPDTSRVFTGGDSPAA